MHGNPWIVCDIGREGAPLQYEHSVADVPPPPPPGHGCSRASRRNTFPIGATVAVDGPGQLAAWKTRVSPSFAQQPASGNPRALIAQRRTRITRQRAAEAPRRRPRLSRRLEERCARWRHPHRRHERRGGQGRWRQARGRGGERDHPHGLCPLFCEPLPPAGGLRAQWPPGPPLAACLQAAQPRAAAAAAAAWCSRATHASGTCLPCPAVQEKVGQDEAGRQAFHVLQ